MKLKRAKVVMLPTNDNQHPTLLLNPSTGRMERPKHEYKYPASEYKMAGYQCYDLYFIGYDKIVKPCWVFNENGVGKENKLFKVDTDIAIGNCAIHNWNEVIATSAKLGYTSKSFYKQFGEMVEETNVIYLPQPSNGFVTTFINSYNKGELITFVNVEYNHVVIAESLENYDNDCVYVNGDNVFEYPSDYQEILQKHASLHEGIKVNPRDNTITIRPIKNSWNREEVENLMRQAAYQVQSLTIGEFDKWIEENL